ncbi:20219_t:CDS:2 [Entrophospora sp. SA101]|nr:20219_t:CDS:2 [Entrophospora sp. SA101]
MTILNSDLSDPFGILAISGEYLYYTRTPESLKVDGFEVAMAILGAVEKVLSAARKNQIIEPKQKALSIIDSLPGNSLIAKTGYITVGTGLLTLAISKEIYVLNEETLLLLSFSTMCAIIYKALKQPVAEWASTQKEVSRVDHKTAVAERIETVGQIGNLVDVTKTLFAMSKETAKLEAEAFELKQKAVAASEIKAVLDSWVRYEASLRERDQKALANYVIGKITEQLKDPKLNLLNE